MKTLFEIARGFIMSLSPKTVPINEDRYWNLMLDGYDRCQVSAEERTVSFFEYDKEVEYEDEDNGDASCEGVDSETQKRGRKKKQKKKIKIQTYATGTCIDDSTFANISPIRDISNNLDYGFILKKDETEIMLIHNHEEMQVFKGETMPVTYHFLDICSVGSDGDVCVSSFYLNTENKRIEEKQHQYILPFIPNLHAFRYKRQFGIDADGTIYLKYYDGEEIVYPAISNKCNVEKDEKNLWIALKPISDISIMPQMPIFTSPNSYPTIKTHVSNKQILDWGTGEGKTKYLMDFMTAHDIIEKDRNFEKHPISNGDYSFQFSNGAKYSFTVNGNAISNEELTKDGKVFLSLQNGTGKCHYSQIDDYLETEIEHSELFLRMNTIQFPIMSDVYKFMKSIVFYDGAERRISHQSLFEMFRKIDKKDVLFDLRFFLPHKKYDDISIEKYDSLEFFVLTSSTERKRHISLSDSEYRALSLSIHLQYAKLYGNILLLDNFYIGRPKDEQMRALTYIISNFMELPMIIAMCDKIA